jgi:putative ATPase
MKGLGYGRGYKYAHDYANAQVDQEHFPPNLQGRRYYEPTGRGFEAAVRERLAWRDDRLTTKDERRKTKDGGSVADGAPSSVVRRPSSVVGEAAPQELAGEESQVAPEDDGAQVRRPAAARRAGKSAKRGE